MKTIGAAYLEAHKHLLESTTADIERLQCANERLTAKLEDMEGGYISWKECAEEAMAALGFTSDSFVDQWFKNDDGKEFDSADDAVRHVLETLRKPAEATDGLRKKNAALRKNLAELRKTNKALRRNNGILADEYLTLLEARNASPLVGRLEAENVALREHSATLVRNYSSLSKDNDALSEQISALAKSYRTLSATHHEAPPAVGFSADGFPTLPGLDPEHCPDPPAATAPLSTGKLYPGKEVLGYE